MNTGRTGMVAARAAISTAGHNISNANTEGYSRQRVHTSPDTPKSLGDKGTLGTGTLVSRVDRVNDEYLDRQLRGAGRDVANLEEKDLLLRQTEDVFNEMGGDGLNRLTAKFFNDFRRLANEPDSEAVRQSVRESTSAMVSDFHRLRADLVNIRDHSDNRLESHVNEINSLATELKDLNVRINAYSAGGALPNDLLDKRDVVLKKMGSMIDLNMHQDNSGNFVVDIKGMGPLVVGPQVEQFSVERSPADGRGKPENSYDLKTSANANGIVTHAVKGGKIGAVLEVRDGLIGNLIGKLDELAYNITSAVNAIHEQGFNRYGTQGASFFKQPVQVDRAAEFMELSDQVKSDTNFIATAAMPDSPGDNRIALAIGQIQNARIMSNGKSTADDFYNSIVSDIGVTTARNRSSMNQQKDIQLQLNKMRDQLSGVSIDEETANLLQFQHVFDASAKVVTIADEMLKTILDMRR